MASATAGMPLLFVSYAHEDRELCRRLVVMLGLVLRARGYDLWWDQTMVAGTWRDQVEDGLGRAAAAVLLVTENSLASSFVMDEELPALLARCRVAPVYGRPCPWASIPAVASLQFLGSSEKSLAEMDDSHGELAAALSAIATQAPEFLGLPPVVAGEAPPRPAPRPAPHAPPPASPELPGSPGARLAGAPDASPDRGPLHGVPELPRGYFERSVVLDQLRAQLLSQASGVFGLQGAAGIGKTVLAAALAHDDSVRARFPDGIYWVVLGERPDLVATQASVAGMAGVGGEFRSVDDGRTALSSAFRDQRVLVVVDDAWSAADVEALLVTGPSGRVVVTTRHGLVLDRLRAQRASIDRLGLEEARRFLSAATGDPGPLPPEADDLVEAVGGVALALALVAATVCHGTTWADALADVRAAGDVYTDESFANQFKALQLAWDALDPDARGRYAELSVLGEDVNAPAVTVGRLWRSTADLDAAATDALCRGLSQRNLLTYDGTVRFHDLQRSFLQLQTADSASAHRQLLDAHASVPATPGRWSTLPDDEPYLWDHLVEHLVGAGDVAGLETTLADPVWLVRRYHLQGPHAPESDLLRGIEAVPTFRLGARLLHRLRQISHLLGAVPTLGDRALTLAQQVADLVPTEPLAALFPPVRIRPRDGGLAVCEALERVVTGHLGGVWSVAWSPDGRRLASAAVDGTIRLWDTDAAGRLSALLRSDRGAVRTVAWSPDGARLASGGDDGTVRVWDTTAPDLRTVAVVRGHDAPVWSVAWSPDGRRLASGGSDGCVGVWSVAGPDPAGEKFRGHDGTVWSVAWSPDGQQVASGGVDGTIRLFDPGEPPATMAVIGRHDGWVWSVAWSPDGRRLASAGDRTVRVWEADDSTWAPMTLAGHDDVVWTMAWSPDGARVASGSADGTVRVWDVRKSVASGEHAVLSGHEDHVWSVAWSPDGRRVASGSHDETVRVWDVGEVATSSTAPVAAGRWLWSVAWSPDGQRVATGAEDGALRVWDAGGPPTQPVWAATLDGGLWAVAWSPDGRWLAAAGADRVVRLWVTTAWEQDASELRGHAGLVRSVSWSPDGARLATAADDGTLRLWDLDRFGHALGVTVVRDHDGMRSRSVVWSRDGRRLASGHDDGTLRLRDASGAVDALVRPGGHEGRVESVAWSPDGRTIATGGLDGTVRLWRADEPGPPTAVLTGHDDPVTTVAWSGDGSRLISGSEDRTVRLWDAASGSAVSALGIGSMICSLACRADMVAVGMVTGWTVLAIEDVAVRSAP